MDDDDTPAFSSLHAEPTANRWLHDVRWRASHPFGTLLYCPAHSGEVAVRLNHHLMGIELDPGIVSLRINHGPRVTNVQKVRTFYFIPAGTLLEVRKETPIEHMLVTFSPRFAERLPTLPDHAIEDMVDAGFAARALALRTQFLVGTEMSQAAAEFAQAAMIALSRAYRSGAYRSVLTSGGAWLDSDRVRRALSFIDGHCVRKIAVEDVADAVGDISASHFAHAFEATLGQSPHQYVLQQRVRRAREMLMRESISIADIAYAVGFSSQAHMTDTFTRRLGATPAQIRDAAGDR